MSKSVRIGNKKREVSSRSNIGRTESTETKTKTRTNTRTQSAGDSKQQGGGVRGTKSSNLSRKTTIGPNERVLGERIAAKEKAGKKLGPNERATLQKYKTSQSTSQKEDLKIKKEDSSGKKDSSEKKGKKQKKSEMNKEDWLKATRNSPAAKSGVFTDDERWAQQQKHRAWKASRGKKK